jgi:hypothetical protein
MDKIDSNLKIELLPCWQGQSVNDRVLPHKLGKMCVSPDIMPKEKESVHYNIKIIYSTGF